MVVYFHAGKFGWVPLISGLGALGIMLFFCLSGFLMAYHYRPKSFSIKYWTAFYARRFFRLYPPFFYAIILSYVFYPYLAPEALWYHDSWFNVLRGWLLIENRGHFWTVPFELKFYLIYPFLALILNWTQFKKRPFLLIIAWIISSVICAYVNEVDKKNTIIYYICFLSGIMAAFLLRDVPKINSINANAWDMMGWYCLAAIFFMFFTPVQTFWSWRLLHNYTWVFSVFLTIFIVCVAKSSYLVKIFFCSSVMRFFGKISYSMYLLHTYIQVSAKEFLPPLLNKPWTMFLLVIFLSWLFYLLVENPWHHIGKKTALKLTSDKTPL